MVTIVLEASEFALETRCELSDALEDTRLAFAMLEKLRVLSPSALFPLFISNFCGITRPDEVLRFLLFIEFCAVLLMLLFRLSELLKDLNELEFNDIERLGDGGAL